MELFKKVFIFLVLVVFVFYSQFYKLNVLTFRIWDEARLATNAFEMTKTGNLLTPTIDYDPDMWNTKPPLMIWTQAICIKFNGLTETSVRLPSAFAAALTIIIVFAFVLYITGSLWFALLGAIILCTSRGYIGYHGTRFGEYDSLLTLFTTSYLICFFLSVELKSKWKNLFSIFFFVFLSLAVLAKSVAALLFLPFIIVWLLYRQQVILLLRNKYFYAGAAIFILLVGGYYGIRESHNHGYLSAVYENEWGGRFVEGKDEHNEYWYFYLYNLIFDRYSVWIWLLPVSIVSLLLKFDKIILRKAILFSLFSAIAFLTIISVSKTKLLWYDIPVYPLLSIVISISLFQIWAVFRSYLHLKAQQFLKVALVCGIAIYPSIETYNMVKWQGDDLERDNFYSVSYYLRDAARIGKVYRDYVFFTNGYDYQWTLYVKRLNEQSGSIAVEKFDGFNEFPPTTKVIAFQEPTKKYIESKYDFKIVEQIRDVSTYIISAKKTDSNY